MFQNLDLKLKGKRGSIQDVIFVIIILFAVAIALIFMMFITNKLNESLSPAFENIAAGSSLGISTLANSFNYSFNWLFLGMFVAYIMVLIISAFMIQTHPIFIPIFIIVLVIGVLFSVIISNVYEKIAATPVIATEVSNMPIANYIMANLPLIFTVIGVVSLIILFSKIRSQASGLQGEP